MVYIHNSCDAVYLKPVFYIGGNVIDTVNQCSHLGHITDNRSNDGSDILF